MKRVVTMISEVEVFHIASIDGDKARVRPFGFIMDFEDKIYFTTGNHKDFYTQVKANSSVEISAILADGKWIRLGGRAVFDRNMAAKKKAFEIYPDFKNLYTSPENPAFEVFYLDQPYARLYSLSGTHEKLL